MYLQMAGLQFMPTGVILYVINYVDIDRQHLARELDERYEPFHHWGEVPNDFSYLTPYRYRLRGSVVEAAPPDLHDYRFHYRRLLLIDQVHAALRAQRTVFASRSLPLQDQVLDLAHAQCQQLDDHGDGEALPLLNAMATAWNTTLATAATRVRMEYADRQDTLVQSEVRRLHALAAVCAARDHHDLDALFVRYSGHD
ncbi:hypothetical protein [Xanthomonas albilineans]|uniref:hypothetical protein n=1 Tax=Xanthomonas albilineans TaxID=29447 RepID=UPI0027D941EC|nr:hypothetical protein [Xanthomonas albilineans]